MRPRSTLRRLRCAALVAVVLAVGAPALSRAAAPTAQLPVCEPARASTGSPPRPPSLDDPRACRARPPRVLESAGPVDATRAPVRTVRRPASSSGTPAASSPGAPAASSPGAPETDGTPAGYHHLGAGTTGQWAGITGRMTVRDADVRRDTWDFLATRFMVKRDIEAGQVVWLEAGWAETGWSGEGRQRIYTYDTNRRAWRFYDDYRLRDGDRLWIDLHTDPDGVWQAWLWWGDRWNLLAAERLPTGPTAHLEQYVEVHVDRVGRARLRVPPVELDNVRVTDPTDGTSRHWRRDNIPTAASAGPGPHGGYCLNWKTHYDTWSAGDCPA